VSRNFNVQSVCARASSHLVWGHFCFGADIMAFIFSRVAKIAVIVGGACMGVLVLGGCVGVWLAVDKIKRTHKFSTRPCTNSGLAFPP